MKQLRSRKPGMIVAEIVTALLFILFLFPFVLVLLNSAKTSFEVTQYPLAWPSRWGNIIDNVVKIWTSESVRYPSSLLTSTIVTVVSLVLINLFSAQAGWVLVRTKSRISSIIFFILSLRW